MLLLLFILFLYFFSVKSLIYSLTEKNTKNKIKLQKKVKKKD